MNYISKSGTRLPGRATSSLPGRLASDGPEGQGGGGLPVRQVEDGFLGGVHKRASLPDDFA
jgi:hypothetical protein